MQAGVEHASYFLNLVIKAFTNNLSNNHSISSSMLNIALGAHLSQAGGSKVGTEVMNQVGTSKPVDRGPWMHGPPENRTLPQQLSGPPLIPSGTGQMGPGNQPRPTPPVLF